MQAIERDDSEMAYRRGYGHGVVETFHAVERFLDPTTREGLRDWIEKDVYAWRNEGDARLSADLAVENVRRSQSRTNTSVGVDDLRQAPGGNGRMTLNAPPPTRGLFLVAPTGGSRSLMLDPIIQRSS